MLMEKVLVDIIMLGREVRKQLTAHPGQAGLFDLMTHLFSLGSELIRAWPPAPASCRILKQSSIRRYLDTDFKPYGEIEEKYTGIIHHVVFESYSWSADKASLVDEFIKSCRRMTLKGLSENMESRPLRNVRNELDRIGRSIQALGPYAGTGPKESRIGALADDLASGGYRDELVSSLRHLHYLLTGDRCYQFDENWKMTALTWDNSNHLLAYRNYFEGLYWELLPLDIETGINFVLKYIST